MQRYLRITPELSPTSASKLGHKKVSKVSSKFFHLTCFVGIHVQCSALGNSAVRDGMAPFFTPKYSKTYPSPRYIRNQNQGFCQTFTLILIPSDPCLGIGTKKSAAVSTSFKLVSNNSKTPSSPSSLTPSMPPDPNRRKIAAKHR